MAMERIEHGATRGKGSAAPFSQRKACGPQGTAIEFLSVFAIRIANIHSAFLRRCEKEAGLLRCVTSTARGKLAPR